MKTLNNREKLLAGFILIPLVAGFSGISLAQGKEKVTPVRGFPNASLTIFPLTVSTVVSISTWIEV